MSGPVARAVGREFRLAEAGDVHPADLIPDGLGEIDEREIGAFLLTGQPAAGTW
jgi:hypothetical protein